MVDGVRRPAFGMVDKSVSKLRPEMKIKTLGLAVWILFMPATTLVYQFSQLYEDESREGFEVGSLSSLRSAMDIKLPQDAPYFMLDTLMGGA